MSSDPTTGERPNFECRVCDYTSDEYGDTHTHPATPDASEGLTEALRIVRLVEQDMAERAVLAWRSASARQGLSDHDALQVHADALSRWSERLRMALEGNDWRDDRNEEEES